MSEYIEVERDLYVPLKPVAVRFHEKEEVELNAFQNFILEAVEDNATIEQMADATQLTKNVIETEMLQMERQKLLMREGDAAMLSELSRNILMVSRSVAMLNEERRILCINLVTGGMEGYEESAYCDPGENGLRLGEKIRSRDVVGIDMEENIAFFADYMTAFRNFSEERIDKVLSSVYVEFEETDRAIVYKRQQIHKLPCLLGCHQLRLGGDLLAEGRSLVITAEVSTDRVMKYGPQIRNILRLYKDFPELFSDLGQELIAEYETCEDCRKENLKFLYDCVSGRIREWDGDIPGMSGKRSQLVLDSGKKPDEEAERQICALARAKWGLDEGYHFKITDSREQIYKVGFCLEELGGGAYEED